MKEQDEINYLDHLRNIKLNRGDAVRDLELTWEMAGLLCEEIYKNAQSLSFDALLLKEHNRLSRSISLAVLAIEEIGKMEIVRRIFRCKDSNQRAKLWNDFRNHKAKNNQWVFYYLKINNATKKDYDDIVGKGKNASNFLDGLKMSAFYVDIDNKGKIYSPDHLDERLSIETIEAMTALIVNTPQNLYSSAYFEVLNEILNKDGSYNQLELYTKLFERGVIEEAQLRAIIANMIDISLEKS